MRYTFETITATAEALDRAMVAAEGRGRVAWLQRDALSVSIKLEAARDLTFWHSFFQGAGGRRVVEC